MIKIVEEMIYKCTVDDIYFADWDSSKHLVFFKKSYTDKFFFELLKFYRQDENYSNTIKKFIWFNPTYKDFYIETSYSKSNKVKLKYNFALIKMLDLKEQLIEQYKIDSIINHCITGE